MNEYEARLEARRTRLLERAAKHRRLSEASFNRVKRITDMIPLGQPILVGHHSERHARADQRRIESGMRKGIDEESYAKELERRGEAVGSGGISSDDPDAVSKLKAEVDNLEKLQGRMKAANVIVRKFKGDEHNGRLALEQAGCTAGTAAKLFEPDFCGRLGFPDYALKNNNANIRRIKQRIAELEKASHAEPREIQGEGYRLEESPDENRVMFFFDAKPVEQMRDLLKRSGFKWSPSRGAWVRFLNGAGRAAANHVMEKLKEP